MDPVDLLQLHSLVHPGDWKTAMGPGGAVEAAVEARAEGLARFIGMTGHGWTIAAMHRRSLERFHTPSGRELAGYSAASCRVPPSHAVTSSSATAPGGSALMPTSVQVG